jgi:hypothetical protein
LAKPRRITARSRPLSQLALLSATCIIFACTLQTSVPWPTPRSSVICHCRTYTPWQCLSLLQPLHSTCLSHLCTRTSRSASPISTFFSGMPTWSMSILLNHPLCHTKNAYLVIINRLSDINTEMFYKAFKPLTTAWAPSASSSVEQF